MRVLAIDTAYNSVSAGVWDETAGALISREAFPVARGHDEHVMPVIARVLQGIEGGLKSIDRIAVSAGPGSFTGLRVGISAAKALGLAASKPVVGIPTLLAFAAGHFASSADYSIAALADARQSRVYFQLFSGDGLCLIEAKTLTIPAAIRLMGSGKIRLTGNAADVVAIEAWTSGLAAEVASGASSAPIEQIAKLGIACDPASAPPAPIYLNAGSFMGAQPTGLLVG